MQDKKRLHIGHSDYRTIIENNGYFVDKTLLIQEVIDSAHEVMIMPRPRRFGKSLNLSMLKYFFDPREEDTEALFKDYQIWNAGERYVNRLGKHPVIHLGLKEAKATTFERSKEHIYLVIEGVYQKFSWLTNTNTLSKAQLQNFKAIEMGEASPATYEKGLHDLSIYLHQHYGEKVVILLDEYDAAIHAGFYYGYYDEIIALMKTFLGSTFKDNTSMYKGVITGILRVAKESIFSDMNNPGIFTILNTDFANRFGFTEDEVKEMLMHYDLMEEFPAIKNWYNGYRFGNIENIYNPWSILNYIDKTDEGFKSYWGNTSSDDIIRQSVTHKDANELREEIEQLIKGETIIKRLNQNITFPNFFTDEDVFWSLLTFAGYLTPAKDLQMGFYELRIPNFEINYLFRNIIQDWLKKEVKISSTTLYKLTRALVSNRISEFTELFKKVMGDTFSYFDINTEPERVYQAYVLGLLGMLSDDYIIKSNRESGSGRYDILLLPKTNKNDYGIIMEFKQIEKDASKKRINTALTKALKQIQDNQYYKELASNDIPNRIEIAVVFAGKQVHLRAK